MPFVIAVYVKDESMKFATSFRMSDEKMLQFFLYVSFHVSNHNCSFRHQVHEWDETGSVRVSCVSCVC